MTITEATELVAMLQVAWPNHPWNAQSSRVYHMGLDDMDGAAVLALIPTLIKTAKFAPTPAEIRAFLAVPEADQWSAELPTGKDAWEEIRAQMRYPGAWGTPRYSHPLIERTSRAFGWQDLCAVTTDQMNTLRAQVERFHDGYRADAIAALNRGVPMDRAILPHGEQHRIAGLMLAEIEAGAA